MAPAEGGSTGAPPAEPDTASVEAEAVRRWLIATLGAALLLVVFAWIAPRLPAVHRYVAGVLAFACVGAEVLTVAGLAPPLRPRALIGLLLPLGAIVAVALAGSSLPPIAAAALVTVSLLGAGTLVGAVVGRAIEAPGHLLVVAIVSALVDAYSVLHPAGPTAQIIQIEAAVDVLILPWPILGTARIDPVLGVGDIAFAAIYAVASRRHGLSMTRTLAALAVGLAATLAVVLATGAGIPALPFLGAAVVIAQPEARRVPPKDRKKALIGVGVLIGLFALMFALR